MKRKDYAKPFRILISVMLLVIVAITILQVIFRFLLDSPFVWSDELGRFLLIWMVFIGAAVVSFDDRHLAVDLIQEKLSPKPKLIINIFIRFLIMIFLVITIYSSIELVQVSHYLKSGALNIPFSYWRVAAPIGALLMIIYTIIRSVIDIQNYRNGNYPMKDEAEEVTE